MQGHTVAWSPPTGVLGEILAQARERVRVLEARAADLERRAAAAARPPSFARALRESGTVAVIAEVKRRSPSRGEIDSSLDAAARASDYERGGAAAISVLTEPNWFGGAPEDLVAARSSVRAPILRKDFITDRVQLVESRVLGASAVLLIARALPARRLCELVDIARELELDPLVEVRNEDELGHALSSGTMVIGINNRDLETLATDPATAERLLPLVPRDLLAVAESGFARREDVQRAADAGADAVLVGTSLSAAGSAGEALRALTGVPRRSRVA